MIARQPAPRWAAGLLALCVVHAGCSDKDPKNGDGDFVITEGADLQITPDTRRIVFEEAGLEVGDSITRTIQVINVGDAKLIVSELSLEYEPPAGGSDGGIPAMELVPPAFSLPVDIFPIDSQDYPQGIQIQVTYTRPPDGGSRQGAVLLKSNDPRDRDVRVELVTETGAPRLTTTKEVIDFQLVPMNTEVPETLDMLNVGTRVLRVSGFAIERDIRFGVEGDDFAIGGGPDTDLTVDLVEAITIPPGESRPVTVTFQSDAPSPAEGTLRIFSDDPLTGLDGFPVELLANKSGPCIQVDPNFVDFGGKKVGTLATIGVEIHSCGSEPLQVKSVYLKPGSSPDFALDFAELPGLPQGPTPEDPLSVPVSGNATVAVDFVADEVNPKDADNVPIPDQATLVVESNAFQNVVEVPIQGAGAEAECPIPVIDITEGEEVVPQTVLHLDGTQSYAPFGGITKYNWTLIEAPDGNVETFVPTPSAPQPIFAVNLVGVFRFGLDVWDETGAKSGSVDCPTAEFVVVVQPDQAIHVELSWQTPGDPDETDTGEGEGTDVDLHFTHPNATGPDLDEDGEPDPWFDKDWDCFWHNDNPNWGSFSPDAGDDPVLDRDDTDGGGPENLNLEVPEDETDYLIGVHFWDDHGFGDIYATTRVFFYALEVYRRELVLLTERDLWCVGHIAWKNAETTPQVIPCGSDTDELIVPDYVNPFFFQP